MSKETSKLDNRKLVIIGVVTVLLLLALSAYLIWESPVMLSKRYQDLECPSCHMSGYLKWDVEEDYEAVDMMVPEEDIRPLFQADSFKRALKNVEEPDVAFYIYLYGHKTYAIVVCQDGEISVSDTAHPDKSTTFWKDDGRLFEAIYEIHLSNGGDPLYS